MSGTRKLAAILAADVVGYSRLMGEDEAGTAKIVRERREAATPIVDVSSLRKHWGQRGYRRCVDQPVDQAARAARAKPILFVAFTEDDGIRFLSKVISSFRLNPLPPGALSGIRLWSPLHAAMEKIK
jgi:hypothetical protein